MNNEEKILSLLEKMDSRLSSLESSVARIEIEHGEKLTILFDAFDLVNTKLDRLESKVDGIKEEVTIHDLVLHRVVDKK